MIDFIIPCLDPDWDGDEKLIDTRINKNTEYLE